MNGWRLRARGRLSFGVGRLDAELDSSCPAVALSGPTGSGKTTLLRALAGLRPLADGFVEAGGEVWQDGGRCLPAWRRSVGWAPQEGLLFPHLTVRENAAFGAREGEGREEVVEAFELRPLLDRRPAHLSGGERQRVALARAFAARPKLLLLDEPFSALDAALRARTIDAVKRLCARWSLPFILVTHDASDATALAQERWEIRDGKVVNNGV